MKTVRVFGVLLVVAACVALASAALANKGSKPLRQRPPSTKVHKATPLWKTATRTFRASASSENGQSNGESDTDNIQFGDQTTPDQPEQPAQESEAENNADTKAGQPGEPGQGHEDPAGQEVNHECTGNCQE
jgi:cytoskeletal protein RodZ